MDLRKGELRVGTTSSRLNVLEGLNSKYTCLNEPPPSAGARGYLTSLKVYVNREVDDEPLVSSFSKLLADQNIIDPQIIKEKITHALSNLRFRDQHVLVQFWSPVTVRKRCLLTTLDQPFGLGVVDEDLYLYRLESEQRMFVVDGEHREELGPPGRIYRQKLPEWSLAVHNLPTKQCSNHGYIDLPVFEPDSGCCVGVIEIITSSTYVDYAFEVHEVSRALKEENLKSPDVFENPSLYIQIENARRPSELDEIFLALKSICDIQNIPLAQTWALSRFSSVVANSGNLEQSCSSFNRNCIGKTCMSTYDLPFYVQDLSMWDFHDACRELHLLKSQGVVGKSMSSCGLCFCEDITKLDEDVYPMGSHARVNGITSCLAIYMISIESDVEYVIEFVLPAHHANETDLQSLVLTVRQQIKNVSSVKLGILSSLQVIGGDPLNWNFESPPSPITILPENEEVLPEPGHQQLLVENELIDVNDVPFSKDESEVAYVEHMEDDNFEIKLRDNAAAGTSQCIVPCLNVGIEDADINEGKPERKNLDDKSNKPKRKRKRAERSIGVEEISKHFGKPMEEAAVNLHVSRSTLKRICRGLDISRWPYKNEKSDSVLKSNQTDVVIHASDRAATPVLGTSIEPLGPTNINVPVSLTEHGNQSFTLVRHKEEQTNLPDGSAQPKTTIGEQSIKITSAANTVKNLPTKSTHKENTENTSAANTVKTLTIKATYKENTVKFPFSLSDGLVKLEELVATRALLTGKEEVLPEPGNQQQLVKNEQTDVNGVPLSKVESEICRGLDIPRWPYKKDKSNSILKSNKTDVVIRASEGAPIPV
ncbi:PB1 domain, RWP-RK domain, Lambda repressor-like, DNA-binding domain protein [Artemisia annua]|uniref:PB1 domain, RWP-RK domain, Lambda repressor-like, DNA-binding domain protein n=1 Tax=Artemisia annua TaxID=35608 RepID=A0A2U1NQ69_ARTAN|nr:PB1 domain, RWP-RK domain, Lambda repressor-like, DNA-binding domain protein [Artemisia annua]